MAFKYLEVATRVMFPKNGVFFPTHGIQFGRIVAVAAVRKAHKGLPGG